MVEVPACEFTMGADADVGFEACKKYYIGSEDECERSWYEDEEPEHTVYVDAYYMDKYEVTNAEYAEFLNEKGNQTEGDVTWLDLGDYALIEYSGNQFKTKSGFAKHPVVDVTWYGAKAYCEWAGKRLPTEAEWEKAARGTDGRKYPWGNTFDGSRVNFCDTNCGFGHANKDYDDGYKRTAPVGSYPSGVSPYGVYDMAGNVWEWTSSHYESYPYDKTDGREDMTLTNVERLVLRGGSWVNDGSIVRTPNRVGWDPVGSYYIIGIRCSRSY